MWEKIAAWIRLLWDTGKQTEDNRADIKQFAEDQRRLFHLVQFLVGDNQKLRDDNQALRDELRQALQHERELRERDIREIELKMRLQISEELRRLPPAEDK